MICFPLCNPWTWCFYKSIIWMCWSWAVHGSRTWFGIAHVGPTCHLGCCCLEDCGAIMSHPYSPPYYAVLRSYAYGQPNQPNFKKCPARSRIAWKILKDYESMSFRTVSEFGKTQIKHLCEPLWHLWSRRFTTRSHQCSVAGEVRPQQFLPRCKTMLSCPLSSLHQEHSSSHLQIGKSM
jgi:hypothetical protein